MAKESTLQSRSTISSGVPTNADMLILSKIISLGLGESYQGLSIDAVSRAARTTRPSVYLRFAGKEDLVTSAVAGMTVGDPLPVTDDTRADLVAEL
jgi:AcrR family transcriptional regulator